jgi:hypothetical protein
MRRIALFLVHFLSVAFAGGSGTAAAAPGDTVHIRLNRSFAQALWVTQTSNSTTEPYVFAERDRRGATTLYFDEFTRYFDASGAFTGSTDVSGTADSGVVFSAHALSSVTASATVPVTSCSYGADFNLIACVDAGTRDVSARWTGEGPITRGVTTSNFNEDGVHQISHINGADRHGTATATVDGTGFGSADLLYGYLGRAVAGYVTICHTTC